MNRLPYGQACTQIDLWHDTEFRVGAVVEEIAALTRRNIKQFHCGDGRFPTDHTLGPGEAGVIGQAAGQKEDTDKHHKHSIHDFTIPLFL